MIGEFAAIGTALCWAISVILFRRLRNLFRPIQLNLWKGILSISGLIIVLLFMSHHQFPNLNNSAWLLLSGAIGIGIGDTAFFSALNKMSETSTLLLTETLAPIMTAVLAMIWISEWLSFSQWMAIAIILLGVDIVIRSRKKSAHSLTFNLSGFSYAAISALCQAIGAVIGRDVLTSSNVDSISASLLRLLGGFLVTFVIILLSKRTFLPKKARALIIWRTLAIATFFGTFLAMVLQTISFTYAPAAIVQSLFASCILFSLIFSWMRGYRIHPRAVIGSVISVIGVFMIFYF